MAPPPPAATAAAAPGDGRFLLADLPLVGCPIWVSALFLPREAVGVVDARAPVGEVSLLRRREGAAFGFAAVALCFGRVRSLPLMRVKGRISLVS